MLAACAAHAAAAPGAAAGTEPASEARLPAPVMPAGLVSIPIAERLQSLAAREDAPRVWEEENAVGVHPEEVIRRADAALKTLLTRTEPLAGASPAAPEAAALAADAAARVTASLIENPVDDPLDDALLAPHPAPLDYVLLEAKTCFSQGRLKDLEELLPLLDGHPLRSYAELWRITLGLKAAPDDPAEHYAFERFIELHRGEYVAERAATDYLEIAEDRLNAEAFRKIYDRLEWNQTEPAVAAWKAYYDLEEAVAKNRGRAEALAAAKRLYRDASPVSKTPFRKLGDAVARADRSWLWTRVVLLVQKGAGAETKRALAALPRPELPAPIAELHLILDRPQTWLRRQKRLAALPPRLAVFAALRLARSAPADAARVALAAVDPQAGAFWRTLVWSQIGFTATTRLDPRANDWFARAGDALPLDSPAVSNPGQIAAWRARAALRAGNWYALGRFIDAMPADAARGETWIYWKARSLEARGLKDLAHREYARIADNITFYGKLADDALGRPYAFSRPPAAMPAGDAVAHWGRNPSVQRAEAFYRMNRFYEGHREWNWAMRGISPEDAVALAAYARRERLIHRMINTSMKSGTALVVIEQRFPRPHAALIERAAAAQQLPAAWIYGLIRQESRFIPAVSSAVGARGLMQVMPGTAAWMARHLGIENFAQAHLTGLEMNLVLGTAYLRMLEEDMGGSRVLATAAYNAGPNRARIWRDTLKDAMEAAVFIETIPYHETREYVKNVLANTHTYAMLEKTPAERFTTLAGRVLPNLEKTADLP